MAAYVSVYRSRIPSRSEREGTRISAQSDPALSRFLAEYDDSFFDWGDDPSFFCAREFLGDVRRASWGVCRRILRACLVPGDLVVFFCARQRDSNVGSDGRWSYRFVGFGTVWESVHERRELWTDERYSPYRRFFNVLIRSDGKHAEAFHPGHDDWEKRLPAYILFDPTPGITEFSLTDPPQVAVYSDSVPEVWDREPLTRRLETLLFRSRKIERRLRTSKIRFAHPHVRLTDDERETEDIRAELSRIFPANRKHDGDRPEAQPAEPTTR